MTQTSELRRFYVNNWFHILLLTFTFIPGLLLCWILTVLKLKWHLISHNPCLHSKLKLPWTRCVCPDTLTHSDPWGIWFLFSYSPLMLKMDIKYTASSPPHTLMHLTVPFPLLFTILPPALCLFLVFCPLECVNKVSTSLSTLGGQNSACLHSFPATSSPIKSYISIMCHINTSVYFQHPSDQSRAGSIIYRFILK